MAGALALSVLLFFIGTATARYHGCFVDQPNRSFPHARLTSHSMTNRMCLDHCFSKGFPYSATEYSYECFCGTVEDFNNLGPAKPDRQCNHRCKGNPNAFCGGQWRMMVKSTGGSAPVGQCVASGGNLARGHPTAQSSLAFNGPASRAVDGNRNPMWPGKSCTHTNIQNQPWWRVDLGASKCVNRVVVVNRKDCCSERLSGFKVHVGDNPNVLANPTCGGPQGAGGVINVNCGGLTGRYVGISLPGRQYLTLCEVEVYGAPLKASPADKQVYIGCFRDIPRRLFPHSKIKSQSLTNAQCAKHCKAEGYAYSATEYSFECFCGTEANFADLGRQLPDGQCNHRCRGNSAEFCGGHWRLSVSRVSGASAGSKKLAAAPLGMESGAIPDASITASSSWGGQHEPFRARLNGNAGVGAWAARHNNVGQWLQVDLGKVMQVTGTIIQGRKHHINQWVTGYKLQYSTDGATWTTYKGSGGAEKVFPGNTDRNTPVTNLLDHPVNARYVRFVIQSWHGHISMRAEVLGLPAASPGGKKLAGSSWKAIPGGLKFVAIGASGVWGVNKHDSIYHRLGTYGKENAPGTGWVNVGGRLKQISVGKDIVWGVNTHDMIYIRTGISAGTPQGTGWRNIGGRLKMVHVSSTSNQVWGVNRGNQIYKRTGITSGNLAGTGWQHVGGALKFVSVGQAGVWGVNSGNVIYYRTGTFGNEASAGTGWQSIPGRLKQITVGNGVVWGVNANNHIYIRQGISASKPTGTDWKLIPGRLSAVYVSSTSNQVWGVNPGNSIFQRIGITTGGGGGKKWRDDGKCGAKFPAPGATPGECNAGGKVPCCSAAGTCGSGLRFCSCPGCIDYRATGERKGTKYYPVAQQKNYNDAKAHCAAIGGHLVDIKSQELHDFLVGVIRKVDAKKNYWVGLHDTTRKFVWAFADGTPLASCTFKNWAPGEPNNPGRGQDCVQLWAGRGFKWDNDYCKKKKYFICQIGPGDKGTCPAPQGKRAMDPAVAYNNEIESMKLEAEELLTRASTSDQSSAAMLDTLARLAKVKKSLESAPEYSPETSADLTEISRELSALWEEQDPDVDDEEYKRELVETADTEEEV